MDDLIHELCADMDPTDWILWAGFVLERGDLDDDTRKALVLGRAERLRLLWQPGLLSIDMTHEVVH